MPLRKDLFHVLFSFAALMPDPTPEFIENYIEHYNLLKFMIPSTTNLTHTPLFEQIVHIYKDTFPNTSIMGCETEDELVQKYFIHDIPPASWGPAAWSVLYCLIGAHPERVRVLLHTWQSILPCPQCKQHFIDYFNANPMPESVDELHYYIETMQSKMK